MSVSPLISCVFEIRPRCYTFCSSDPRKQTVLPPSIPLSLAFLLHLLLLIYPSLFSLSPHSWVNVCSSVIIFFQRSILKHTKHGILHCTVTSLPCLHTLTCWPCLAGGRAVHKGTSKSLIYVFFFHFQRQIVQFFASPHSLELIILLSHTIPLFFIFKCYDSRR